MNENILSKLRQDAMETLDNLDLEHLSKDGYLLAGASLALLEYISGEEKSQAQAQRAVDVLPESSINENIDEMNIATVSFWRSIDAYENSRSALDRDNMVGNLQKLLEWYEKMIVELRLKIRDPECIDLMKQFYAHISNRI